MVRPINGSTAGSSIEDDDTLALPAKHERPTSGRAGFGDGGPVGGARMNVMDDEKKVPEGRFGRFARLAAMGVRTGAGMLVDRDGGGTAKNAAAVLGTLRGLAAKVGQMASYVDGVVPEAHR